MKEAWNKNMSSTGYGFQTAWIGEILYQYVENPWPMLVGHELNRVERTWVRKIVKGSLFLVPLGIKPIMVKTAADDLFLLWKRHKSMKLLELNENFDDICCLRVHIKMTEDGQLHATACDKGFSEFYSYSFITHGCSIQRCFAVEI
ncbi:hypothetical protein S83_009267 [Arachis hypogaea]|nr:uncharacterized protein DS421_3g91860 [Arachis hypogaea]